MGDSRLADIVARAAAGQARVADMDLDVRLGAAAASRSTLAEVGEEIVELAVHEAGTPRRFARREVTSALELLDALPMLAAAIRPRLVPAVSGTTTLEWRPYGVVFGWHSANSPVWVPTLVAASALVAGNAAVCRPSRRVRRTTMRVLEAIASAWPPGAVVIADVGPDDGHALIAHPGVHAVVAHASTATCKRHLTVLGQAYAEGIPLRPYIPEASGNDALVVLPGADLARAAAAAALGGFANAGQLCMSAKRLVVDARVWPALRLHLQAAIAEIVVGDPGDEATDIGPVMDGPARRRAVAAFAEALAAGARIVAGGRIDAVHFAPTLLQLPRDRLGELGLWREEVFAPLRSVVVCDGAGDALALANDTPYGLGAAVFGGSTADRELLLGGLRAARVVLDEGPLYQDPHLVVGGVGDSGVAGARPKLEQLVWARRVHRAAT